MCATIKIHLYHVLATSADNFIDETRKIKSNKNLQFK